MKHLIFSLLFALGCATTNTAAHYRKIVTNRVQETSTSFLNNLMPAVVPQAKKYEIADILLSEDNEFAIVVTKLYTQDEKYIGNIATVVSCGPVGCMTLAWFHKLIVVQPPPTPKPQVKKSNETL